MQTLKWYPTGYCANPPGNWQVVVTQTQDYGWQYEATQIEDLRNGWDVVHVKHRQDGYPTERAAQIACEAFCWRNGILPLPAWADYELQTIKFVALVDGADWQINTVDGRFVARGYSYRDAQAAAERHLRCEIAAALDAEAAKEANHDHR